MEEFPAIPRLLLPESFKLPVPILELPQADLPRIQPIFIPQTVLPGSLSDLEPPQLNLPPLEQEEPEAQEEDKEDQEETEEEEEEESPEETQESQETEETSPPQDKGPAAKTLPPLKPPTLVLPPIQTTPIEVPSDLIIDNFSLPGLAEEPEEPEKIQPVEKELEGVITVQIIGIPVPIPEPEILVAAGATATVSVAATLASTSILKQVTGLMKPVIKKIFNIIAKIRGKKSRPTWARERLEQRRNKRQKTGN